MKISSKVNRWKKVCLIVFDGHINQIWIDDIMDLAKSRHQKGIWTKILQIINKNYGRFQSIQIDMKLVK